MGSALLAIIGAAGSELTGAAMESRTLRDLGDRGLELQELLAARNGFYAFGDALLVRPLQYNGLPLGIAEWNEPHLWKSLYDKVVLEALCFAEDVFGCQYCITQDRIGILDPETGEIDAKWATLLTWAEEVAGDAEFRTGSPIAERWRVAHGPIQPGKRLVPKTPFVVGGSYDIGNLRAQDDVDSMRFRSAIAAQIKDIPDGAEIKIKIQYE